jgi:NADH dehydrogenase
MSGVDVVTGAFSYTGRLLAPRLLARGRGLRTLTNHPDRSSPLFSRVPIFPLDFSNPGQLVQALRGADTLYNTYWVRSNHGAASFAQAVSNTGVLLDAARKAGIRRVVHVSIANPMAADLPYYRGKAACEEAVRRAGIGYGIVRPTLLFGHGDVLINNITWFLRHLPLFGIPGDGRARLQPVFVEDYVELLVEAGAASGNVVLEAGGPEIFSFEELVRLLARAVRSRSRIVRVPPALSLLGTRLAGLLVRDMVLTRDELRGLMADILVSPEPPRCPTRLSDWLSTHQEELGRHWASELNRHYRLGGAA